MAFELVVCTNTYISLDDANDYFASRLDADGWDKATPEIRKKALATATRAIDSQRLRGKTKDASQALQFPRSYQVTQAASVWIGNLAEAREVGWVSEAETPQAVKDAVCEEALFLLSMTAWDKKRDRQQALGVVDMRIADTSESIDAAVARSKAFGGRKLMSPVAKQLMAPYLIRSVAIS